MNHFKFLNDVENLNLVERVNANNHLAYITYPAPLLLDSDFSSPTEK